MKSIIVKFGNMRGQAQEFVLYPYNGGDTLLIQSDKRIAQINLKTGKTVLSKQCQNGAYFPHLNTFLGTTIVDFPQAELIKLKEHLWKNAGIKVHRGVIITEDKELYSEK